MEKIKKAFTLIELLVVVTIISLISSAWIFYFLDFVQEQEISQRLYLIEENIKELDTKVKNYEIFDYVLNFNTSYTWSKLYTSYINNFDSENQEIIITNSTWSWIIIGNINSWSWILKIYKEEKLFLNEEINRNKDYKYNFNDSKKYKITWTFSWAILNEIHIDYFSEDNVKENENNNLELININTKEDKLWINITNLKITNIWWIKKFYNNWIVDTSINEVFLLFNNNWKEKYIKIK